MGKPTPVFKLVLWTLAHADKTFSLFIRKRDGRCMRCKRADKALDCSHYWRRDMWGTRFDPKNCVALCRDCHTLWERHQNPEYKAWMIRWIGQAEYDALEHRARTYKGRRNAIAECMTLFGKNSPE